MSDPRRLFTLSCVALVAGAFVFSVRTATIPSLAAAFGLSNEAVNTAVAAASYGFALTIFLGSPACDWVGMGRLLILAGLLHAGSTLATIFARELGGAEHAYSVLWGSMFAMGLAHGLVEAVINPLAATLYPAEKTHKLNVLHAWWPGGLIVGSVIAFGLGWLGCDWRVQWAVVLVPSLLYLALTLGQRFPATERVASGVSNATMFREAARPLFLVFLFAMMLTASTELAPNQLLETLSQSIGMSGTLVLGYISALMFGLRFFAGPVAHRLSPVGLLWFSSLLAGIGLLALSYANQPLLALAAATVFGVGVCYMWPTMLGVASELFPKGGAFLMGLLATAANIALAFVLPEMGRITDEATRAFQAQGMTAAAAKAAAAPLSFRYVAALPVVLLVIFGAVWLYLRARGGYAAVRREQADAIRLGQADPADFGADALG